jgi:hypothetical protein
VRIPSLLAGAVLLASPAFAQFNVGITPTYGPASYKGLSVFGSLGYGGNWSLSPAYSQFSSDNTNGTVRNISARLGYDQTFWGAGVTVGTTLKVNGYTDYSAGGDFTVSISPSGKQVGVHRIGVGHAGAPEGSGLARIDLGVGGLVTQHKTDSSGTPASATLNQSDLYGAAGASLLGAEISAKLTKSYYDKDLTNTAVPAPVRVPVDGLMTLINNYPDSSLRLGVELPLLPIVTPFVTYTETTYKQVGPFTPGETRGTGIGVRVGLQLLEVDASYQHVMVTGGTDQDFTSVGAGLRF